jgi:hypothetical protein
MWSGCAFSLPAPRTSAVPKMDSGLKTHLTTESPLRFAPEWTPFQPYLQKVVETVQNRWERSFIESRISPPTGTSVTVVFQMTMDGKISNIIDVEGTANERAKKACIGAIRSRASYPRWTPEMIAALGQSQKLTFTFFYE